MTDMEFQTQMERISKTFGRNFYTEERLARIWQHCAELPAKNFKYIVDNFIDSLRTPPTPSDFREQKVLEMKRLEAFAARFDGHVLSKITNEDKGRIQGMLKREGVLDMRGLFEKRRREQKAGAK